MLKAADKSIFPDPLHVLLIKPNTTVFSLDTLQYSTLQFTVLTPDSELLQLMLMDGDCWT